VKKLKWWGALALVTGAALAGCGGNSDSNGDSASLRIANATLTHPSLDLLVNSSVSVSATASDTVSAYVGPASGSNTLQLNDAGAGTALATIVPTLTAGSHYTLLAYESGGVVKTSVVSEDVTAPASGVATLRIFDAAIEAGALDVYISTGDCSSANLSALSAATSFGVLTSPQAVSLTQGAGTYNVCVTGSGTKSDLRMSMPLAVTSQQVVTVFMTPASGGLLLNGSTLVQQGAYAAVRNTNTRVRLASAVSGGDPVTASASNAGCAGGTCTIDSGVSPAFGFYTLVPAASSLNITVNSNSVGAPATALPAGGDVTLLVYGSAASATASLIVDDNRPPSVSTSTKLRLINGVTGNVGNLTLTANSSPVGISVAPSAASSYVSLSSTASSTSAANTFSFALSSSTVGPLTLPTSSATGTVSANTAYSVLAVGDVSAPQLLIR